MLTTLGTIAAQVPLGDALGAEPARAVVLLFAAGVLTSLTPCIYPMIPITAGIVAGGTTEGRGRGRAVGLTLSYVAGLALLYASAGLLAGLTGTLFGTVASSVWARMLLALFLAIFGLAMLDVIPVTAPRRLAAWAGGLKGGSYPSVFALGASSGIVAAPCGAPVFAAVLTWVSTTRSALLGFLYLFVFSLGMTALLVAVGLASGSVRWLPRAGRWTSWVKRGAGVALLLMAAYYAYQAWLVW